MFATFKTMLTRARRYSAFLPALALVVMSAIAVIQGPQVSGLDPQVAANITQALMRAQGRTR